MDLEIRAIATPDPHLLPSLASLLIDAVADGASIGFLSDLNEAEAARYWAGVFANLDPAGRSLWVAQTDGQVVGTVQLERCQKPNGRHRAEIQKLMVDTRVRRQGIAARLMEWAEAFARDQGVTLLVLDTLSGSSAEPLYRKLGWQHAGNIPSYAATPDGALWATAYYYKMLNSKNSETYLARPTPPV